MNDIGNWVHISEALTKMWEKIPVQPKSADEGAKGKTNERPNSHQIHHQKRSQIGNHLLNRN